MIPKISVIVPVYKAEQYLPRCVDSILTQSFTDFELILVDDGSPDNSGGICDEYAVKDNRVRVIHKPNCGVSTARNFGIEVAKGDWITFIDADDYIEQGFLSIPVESSADLLIQNYKVVADSDVIEHEFGVSEITSWEIQEFLHENICKEIFSSPWAKFFKNKILKDNDICFPKGIKVGEDALFVLDYLFYTKTIRFLSVSNYVYVGGWQSAKYKITAEKAVGNFREFFLRYTKLNVNSELYLRQVFLFYYGLFLPKDSSSLKTWQKDKVVGSVYSVIYKGLGIKWNLIYIIYPLYKRFIEAFNKK